MEIVRNVIWIWSSIHFNKNFDFKSKYDLDLSAINLDLAFNTSVEYAIALMQFFFKIHPQMSFWWDIKIIEADRQTYGQTVENLFAFLLKYCSNSSRWFFLSINSLKTVIQISTTLIYYFCQTDRLYNRYLFISV